MISVDKSVLSIERVNFAIFSIVNIADSGIREPNLGSTVATGGGTPARVPASRETPLPETTR